MRKIWLPLVLMLVTLIGCRSDSPPPTIPPPPTPEITVSWREGTVITIPPTGEFSYLGSIVVRVWPWNQPKEVKVDAPKSFVEPLLVHPPEAIFRIVARDEKPTNMTVILNNGHVFTVQLPFTIKENFEELVKDYAKTYVSRPMVNRIIAIYNEGAVNPHVVEKASAYLELLLGNISFSSGNASSSIFFKQRQQGPAAGCTKPANDRCGECTIWFRPEDWDATITGVMHEMLHCLGQWEHDSRLSNLMCGFPYEGCTAWPGDQFLDGPQLAAISRQY